MLWTRYQIIFFCSSVIDEIWIRSTALCLARFKVKIAIIIYNSMSDDISIIYKNTGIKVIVHPNQNRLKKCAAKILVSSSTNIKKSFFSSKIKHFVHMPHSLVSLHGVYPHDAFDSYNTLFACSPYHIKEFEKIAELRCLGEVNIFETGYGKLDILLQDKPIRDNEQQANKHILVAPSWGDGNILETIGYEITLNLLKKNYKVTLRPHSMFYLDKKAYMEPFLSLQHDNFRIEQFLDSNAIYDADILITDFSGIAFEYASIKDRKIIFVDTAPKIFNAEFEEHNLPLFEAKSRDFFGLVVPCDLIAIMEAIEKEHVPSKITSEFLFNKGKCGIVASHQIMDILEK